MPPGVQGVDVLCQPARDHAVVAGVVVVLFEEKW